MFCYRERKEDDPEISFTLFLNFIFQSSVPFCTEKEFCYCVSRSPRLYNTLAAARSMQLHALNRQIGGAPHVHHTPPPQREFRLSAGGHSAGAQNRQVLFPPGFFCIWGSNGMQWCCPMQLHARNNQNSPSSTQNELKIHGQKGHFWRSRVVEKKIPFKLSALPQTFTSVQTH